MNSPKLALSTDDLSLTIGGAMILDGISLSVHENETLGIIGPNGAGKTSFFNLLSGLRKPSRGKIHLGEVDITSYPPHKRASLGIARTFQTSSIFVNLTLLENVRIAAQAALGHSMNTTRNAYKYREAVALANDCLSQVGLGARALQIAKSLSHGDKRRLEIAIVLASQAKVILLDEPMAGMSVENVPALVEIIRSLAVVHKKTVLIVEHHMEVILGLADRLAVLNYGELLICDTPDKVIANPIVQSAYLGSSL
ncbi:MAG: ABC transporter ATP-binding protein [Actinobacteria bacterium]|nr:ABC transporter ATP-binding protein [Actinomycetota bacterium]